MRCLLMVVLLSAAAPSVASAQAWTRDQGSFYANLSYRYMRADEAYGPDQVSRPIVPYTLHTIGFYGEVGLVTRWLTLSADGELYRRNGLEDRGYTHGLGDLRLGLWTGLVVEPFRLAAGVVVGLPTGDPSPGAPGLDAGAQLIARSLPTGDGEFDAAFRLVAGHSFGGSDDYPLLHYAVADLGFWARTSVRAPIDQDVHHSIIYRLEFGTRLTETEFIQRFLLILRLVGVESFASDAEAGAAFDGLGDAVTYTAYGVELIVDVGKGFGVGAALESAFRGRSIAAASVLKFSLSFEQ